MAASLAALLVLATLTLSPGGISAIDLLLLILFALTTPWFVVGFWNAAIGFAIMRWARDPVAAVIPQSVAPATSPPAATSTAIVMCVRNELPDRVVRNLTAMMDELAAAGASDRFHVYVLSDTSRPDIALAAAT